MLLIVYKILLKMKLLRIK